MKLVANAIALSTMVAVGAYNYSDAYAVDYVNVTVSKEEKHCLTQNVYFESRNQSTLGQMAVARVTLNRVNDPRYPDTICGVVWQDKQFSWTHDGKSDEPGETYLEQKAWKHAEQVAHDVLVDVILQKIDPVEGSVMFHADYVTPSWADAYDKVVLIDDHIFYKENDNGN